MNRKSFLNMMFIHDTELTAIKKMRERIEKRLFYYLIATPEQIKLAEERRKRNEDNRKLAYIKVFGIRKMAWVDNKTLKAYKADGYEKTWIEIRHFVFERWCTSFDL